LRQPPPFSTLSLHDALPISLPEPVKLAAPDGDLPKLLCTVRALETPPVLIVVDTLARAMTGSDENSSKDMGLLVESADELRRAKIGRAQSELQSRFDLVCRL